MKTGVLTTALAFAATFAFLSLAGVSGAGSVADGDGDGFQNNIDNCATIPNASQYDSDRDGIGNRCDQDADQNGGVGGTDFGFWKSALGTTLGQPGFNPDVDFDEPPNNGIGGTDFGQWKLNLGNDLLTLNDSGRACANPQIDVNDQFEGLNDGANTFSEAGTADNASVGCPDTRRRGTFTFTP